jgi:hypothetical protein
LMSTNKIVNKVDFSVKQLLIGDNRLKQLL